jgi:signal transduction histidine kinase
MTPWIKAREYNLAKMLPITAVALIGISLVVVGAWWSDNLILASVDTTYVPMTMSVALAVLFLSSALLIRQHRPEAIGIRNVPLIVALMVLVVACWVLVDFRLNTGVDLDKLFGASRGTASGYVLAEASPISAITVIVASACCVLTFCDCLLRKYKETLVSAMALFVFSVGLVVTLGYLYGSPLLYGGEVRPVALLAGISYALLGFALALAQGPDRWPVSAFVGSTVRARLMRSFLPIIIAVVIVSGSLSNGALLTSSNPALTASLIALVTVIVVGFIITRLSKSIGGEIDHANAALLKAREELRLANEKLTVLGSITRHDALNRLAVVLGRLELIKQRTEEHAIRKHLEESLTSAKAVQSIIEFTGEYQNIGVAGPVWVDVEESFREAVRDVDHDAVTVDSEARGLEVLADEMFTKVLANLVDNSLRHGVRVGNVRLDHEIRDEGLVLVYTDDGIGLTEEEKANLFRRGFGKHTGLGMYLSKEILLFTGLTISETGTPGKWVRFEIVVPKGKYRLKGRGSESPE